MMQWAILKAYAEAKIPSGLRRKPTADELCKLITFMLDVRLSLDQIAERYPIFRPEVAFLLANPAFLGQLSPWIKYL